MSSSGRAYPPGTCRASPCCGEKIYQKNAFYPWLVEGPFRCKCPTCGRVFPSNDLAQDDFTCGDYPDDGWGWDSTGSGQRQDAYGWVGYAVERHWMGTGNVILRLALRGLLVGDREAAHRAGLLLARLAYVYPGMDMR